MGLRSSHRLVLRNAAILVVAVSTLFCGGCTDYAAVRPGMSSEDVKRVVGVPDKVISEKSLVDVYVGDHRCAAGVRSIMLYRRRFRTDVAVGLDTRSRVVCTWEAFVVQVTY